jgi:hypothetical protein
VNRPAGTILIGCALISGVGRAADGNTARLLDGPDGALRAFLRKVWHAEDPYLPDPDHWLDDDLDGSFARLAEPGGAVVEEDGAIIGAVLVERPHREATAP